MILNTKYIFLGTPEFAAIVLEKLISADFIPKAVISNPDKPTGRKQIITPPPVKALAEKHNLPIYQPKDKNELFKIVKKLNPDLAVVVAYGMIFPKEVLNIPKYGFVNVHPSLLPKYRGAAPIQAAILNGEEKTGVSLFLIDEEMDHGSILAQKELENYELRITNYEKLSKKLAELGAKLLIDFLPRLIRNSQSVINNLGVPQDESKATYTKKIKTEDAFINLEKDNPIEMERKIRALNPEPGTWTMKDGKRIKILGAVLIDEKLKITKIQVEGGKPQNVCGIV